MIILSIHYQTHDTSVAVIKNDRVLFVASEERYSRKKMDQAVPIRALRKALEHCGLNSKDIDKLVFVGKPGIKGLWSHIVDSTRAIRLTNLRFPFYFSDIRLTIKWIFFSLGIPSYIKRQLIPELIIRKELNWFNKEVTYVPHHISHAYSTYYTCGWKNTIVGVIEGAGYSQSMSFWNVTNGKFELITETNLPHSAGRFYELVTLLLGFDRLRHAGKITGLASFGNSDTAYKVVSRLLWVEGLNIKIDYEKYYKWIAFYHNKNELPKVLKKYSKEDLAAAFQRRLEECITDVVENVQKVSGLYNIALAGGVVANVKLNQRIKQIKKIRKIHIHQAMGDSGLALGAALYVANKNNFSISKLDSVYLGTEYSDHQILKEIKKSKFKFKRYKNIEKEIAKLISKKKVVARFNGRSEYGPRSLGNRSILYEAKDKTVNDWLNKRLNRTEFMPFAPVTLDRFANRCYKNLHGAEYPSRYMTITFDCTPYMKRTSPAVVHIDNTARPQVIRKKDNVSYYKILNEYYKITKIPTLVNTSFNMHGEPIVETPKDALRSFALGSLDVLAIGNYIVEK